VPRDDIPDMPDRIVAATALHLSVPIPSRDWRIRASNLQTLW
jgi:PIN domain nuclease of toxin-antitoxin system